MQGDMRGYAAFFSLFLHYSLAKSLALRYRIAIHSFFDMAKTHHSYTAEEKTKIILEVLSRKTSIQKIAKEKNVAATLVSLWKRQAEEAIVARFQPQPRGRRKSAAVKGAEPKAAVREMKAELRKARAKATRTETSLKNAKAKLALLEGGVKTLAGAMGCTLHKAAKKGRK